MKHGTHAIVPSVPVLGIVCMLVGCSSAPVPVQVHDRDGRVRALYVMIDGRREGPSVFYDSTGRTLCTVMFHDDLKHGDQFVMNEKGDTIEGYHFVHGLSNGIQFQRSERGSFTRIETYRHGKPHGRMLLFNDDGTPREMSRFVDGVVDGPHYKWWQGDTTGTYFMEGPLDMGQPAGQWRWHFGDGRISRQGSFSRGLHHGTWQEWDRTGRLVRRFVYDHGTILSDTRY